MTLEERFWPKVDRGDATDCWEWTAATNDHGYGQIRVDGRTRYAHRVVVELDGREVGDANVLHTCDNPACVNPAHLYVGDQSDNLRDAYERGGRPTGERHHAAKLSSREVAEIRARAADGETHAEIATDFPVGRRMVSRIASGESRQYDGRSA